MAHGFSATIDGMVADRYAEVFAHAGFVVLLFDHRGFGRSAGEPRQRVDRWLQIKGYRDAIAFVTTLDEVDPDRIAVWGDSLSGGCAIVVAAFDRRVAALVAQVPACGARLPPPDPDGEHVATMAATYASSDPLPPPARSDGPMPVVSTDQLGTPSVLAPLSAYRWFVHYGAMHGTGWSNQITLAVRVGTLPEDPVMCAPRVRAPSMFVIARDDEMPGSKPAVSRLAYDLLGGPKALVEIEGGHFGLLYHPSDLFDRSSAAQRDFLLRVLGSVDRKVEPAQP